MPQAALLQHSAQPPESGGDSCAARMGVKRSMPGPGTLHSKILGIVPRSNATAPLVRGRSAPQARMGVWRSMPGPGTLRSKVLGIAMLRMAIGKHAGARNFAQQSFGDSHVPHGYQATSRPASTPRPATATLAGRVDTQSSWLAWWAISAGKPRRTRNWARLPRSA